MTNQLLFLFIVFISISQPLFSQKTDKLLYNAAWKGVNSLDEASYYRVINSTDNIKYYGPVKDYYITGEIQGEGDAIYIDKDDDSKSLWRNTLKTYFKNGNKKYEYQFNSDGLPHGIFYDWYENGTLKSEIEFEHGKFNGKNYHYHENGKIKLKAFYRKGKLLDKWIIDCDEFEECKKVFIEDFNSVENINNWPLQNNGKYATKIIEKVGLKMESMTDIGYFQFIHIPINIEKNFSIETILKHEYGDENYAAGLIWGFKDWENYNSFSISRNGLFTIGSKYEGVFIKFIDWTYSESINLKTKRNLIKLNKINDKVYYSINGQIVHVIDFFQPKSNNIGFQMLQGNNSVVFENLIVREDLTTDNFNSNNSEWKSTGTGFIIDPRGYVLTNYHVIEGYKDLEIEFNNNGKKESFGAILIESDKQNDIALLKINSSSFKPMKKINFSTKNQISDVGTNVFTLGYPLTNLMGEEIKFTDGKISSKSGFQGDITKYQVSVPVQPGNSGGPLFDYAGNLIGIVSSKITTAENVTYAIKINYANNLLDLVDDDINLPNDKTISQVSLTSKIKLLSEFIVLLKVR